MSEYNRFTRECTLGQLRPELRQAIRAFFKEHELDEQSAGILACYETTSEKKSTGKLVAWLNDTSDTTVHIGMLLTPDWLIWARSGDRSGTRLNSANLKEIRVKVYSSRLTQDAGLEVSGYISSSKGRVKGYIGMESEAVAQKFSDQVKQAIDKVNPPSARKMPRWLRGD